MSTKYHGHTYYYQQLIDAMLVFSLRLFVVGGKHIAMAMVAYTLSTILICKHTLHLFPLPLLMCLSRLGVSNVTFRVTLRNVNLLRLGMLLCTRGSQLGVLPRVPRPVQTDNFSAGK